MASENRLKSSIPLNNKETSTCYLNIRPPSSSGNPADALSISNDVRVNDGTPIELEPQRERPLPKLTTGNLEKLQEDINLRSLHTMNKATIETRALHSYDQHYSDEKRLHICDCAHVICLYDVQKLCDPELVEPFNKQNQFLSPIERFIVDSSRGLGHLAVQAEQHNISHKHPEK